MTPSGKVDCPQCDRGGFAGIRGLNAHLRQAHGLEDVNSKVELECDWCGETFNKRRHLVERSENDFCSQECHKQHRGENAPTGEDHHNYNRVTVECDYCGSEFTKTKSNVGERNFCTPGCYFDFQAETDAYSGENNPKYSRVEKECEECGSPFVVKRKRADSARFCSPECRGAGTYRELNSDEGLKGAPTPTGEDHPKWCRVEIPCSHCGEVLLRAPSNIEGKENTFCNIDCMAQWLSENLIGERHPDYKKQKRDRPRCRESIKRKVRERDGKACIACGMDAEEHKEIRGTNLHVHHIIPAYKFDSRERANDPDNLITLCWQCHHKWERIPGLIPQRAD